MFSGLRRKPLQLLLPWGAALALSAALVQAGRHWPEPLWPQAWSHALIWPLLLLPPAAMALLLLLRLGAPEPDRGESSHPGEEQP